MHFFSICECNYITFLKILFISFCTEAGIDDEDIFKEIDTEMLDKLFSKTECGYQKKFVLKHQLWKKSSGVEVSQMSNNESEVSLTESEEHNRQQPHSHSSPPPNILTPVIPISPECELNDVHADTVFRMFYFSHVITYKAHNSSDLFPLFVLFYRKEMAICNHICLYN